MGLSRLNVPLDLSALKPYAFTKKNDTAGIVCEVQGKGLAFFGVVNSNTTYQSTVGMKITVDDVILYNSSFLFGAGEAYVFGMASRTFVGSGGIGFGYAGNWSGNNNLVASSLHQGQPSIGFKKNFKVELTGVAGESVYGYAQVLM